MHKYVIVHFINETQVAKEFQATNWPLHITLLGNHNTEVSVEKLFEELFHFAKNCKPLTLLVEGEDFFGVNKNILVSKIQMNKNIVDLHKGLKSLLDTFGVTYDNPDFVGEGYRPHATVQKHDRLYTNQDIVIDSFSLVDMAPNGDSSKRRVLKTFNL